MSKKKLVIIFGGNGLIGKELSRQFDLKKTQIISVDLNFNFTDSIERSKKNILNVKADVSNEISIFNLKNKIIKRFKKVDNIIYLATYKAKDFYSKFTESSLDGWKKTLEVELNGAFIVSKIFGKEMEKKKLGNFVFLSSIYGVVGNDHSIYEGSNLASVYAKNKKQKSQMYSGAVYPVAKGGIMALTKYLSTYWGKHNIRVNCVSPGGIYNKSENKIFLKNYSKKVPMGRKAKVKEICDSIIFLTSDNSSYVNGHNLIVDGGFTAW